MYEETGRAAPHAWRRLKDRTLEPGVVTRSTPRSDTAETRGVGALPGDL